MMIFIYLLLILNTVESFNGSCVTIDRFGKRIYFCCDNYEMINGVCVECMDGFESLDGSQCRPCHRGFYGRKCMRKCYCKMDEKCDHVIGCLRILPTTEAVTEHDHVEGTFFSADELTTEINDKRGSSLSSLGPADDSKGKTGIDDSKLPILAIIGISTVLMLLVFVSLIWVCWKYKVPCKKRKQEEGPSNTETSCMHAEENQVYFINQDG